MLSSVTELHSYIDRSQLTQELGGTQEYCHEKWISHRTVSTESDTPFIHFYLHVMLWNVHEVSVKADAVKAAVLVNE